MFVIEGFEISTVTVLLEVELKFPEESFIQA